MVLDYKIKMYKKFYSHAYLIRNTVGYIYKIN